MWFKKWWKEYTGTDLALLTAKDMFEEKICVYEILEDKNNGILVKAMITVKLNEHKYTKHIIEKIEYD